MPWFRASGRLLGYGLLVMLLVPTLAWWPSAFLDRGPEGAIRVSAFPMALVVFDPFVWTCVGNSAAVALATVLGSVGFGVGLGLLGGRGTSRGGGAFWALMLTPMAASPLLMAPAIASAIGGDGGWDWLAARSLFGVTAESPARWLGLIWTGLAVGVPIVAIAMRSATRRIDPAWLEAARALGASRSVAWRDAAWPILRPEVARAAAVVFSFSLIEPAGPMILGLRRTLAVQIVEAALRLEQPTRAATLALLAVASAMVGRSLIGSWGGTSYARADHPYANSMTQTSVRRAFVSTLAFVLWCTSTVGPLGFWLGRVLRAGRAGSPGPWSSWIADRALDPSFRAWGMNSAISAGLSLTVGLILLRALSGSSGRFLRLSSRVFEALPPLAIGVGAMTVPWLILAMADASGAPVGGWLRSIALELSPGRSPGFLLILALAGLQWPILAGVAEAARGQIRPARVAAARIMGESDRRAVRSGGSGWLGVGPMAPALVAFAMASTSLAPALVLTPTSERRTFAPGLLGLLTDPEGVDPRAMGPIAFVLGLNVMAVAAASRGRPSGI